MRKVLIWTSLLFSACSSNNEQVENNVSTADTSKAKTETVIYDDIRAAIKLSISDTLKHSKEVLFSDNNNKDIFLLTINPGPVKTSKSKIEIISHDHKSLYSETFDTYYFIMYIIHDADTIPTLKFQTEYFQKNVKDVFESLHFITTQKDWAEWTESFGSDWTNDADKEFLTEVRADTTIKLLDLACFNCEEGGYLIGYSKKQGKVVTLLSHD
jgi:hypothetical protein